MRLTYLMLLCSLSAYSQSYQLEQRVREKQLCVSLLRDGRSLFSDSLPIKPWHADTNRARVAIDWETGMASGDRGAVPYRYQISQAQGSVLVYAYDFSLNPLQAKLLLYEPQKASLCRLSLPLDANMTSQGYFAGAWPWIYHLETGEDGFIYLSRFQACADNPLSQAQQIEVAGSGYKKRSFQLAFSAEQVYLACLSESLPGESQGVLVIRFDFKKEKADQVWYHAFSHGFREKINKAGTGLLDISALELNLVGEVKLKLEKRQLLSPQFVYNPYQSLKEDLWKPRQQKLVSKGHFEVSFSLGGRLVREESLDEQPKE